MNTSFYLEMATHQTLFKSLSRLNYANENMNRVVANSRFDLKVLWLSTTKIFTASFACVAANRM